METPITPTATELLSVGQAARDATALEDALNYLRPYRATAEATVPAYRTLAAEAGPHVKHGLAENLTDLQERGLPAELAEHFRQELAHCAGIPKVLECFNRGITNMDRLRGEDCHRTPWALAAGTWPAKVCQIRDDFLFVAVPIEGPRRHLDNLIDLYTRIAGWATGYLARTRNDARP